MESREKSRFTYLVSSNRLKGGQKGHNGELGKSREHDSQNIEYKLLVSSMKAIYESILLDDMIMIVVHLS